jgi:hypothetical protein
MYLAHISAALVAKTNAPRASLGVLLVASVGLDVLSGILALTGVERLGTDGTLYYPWSHGLLMSGVWSVTVMIAALLISRDLRTSFVVGAVVLSHWALDFVSHPMGFGTRLPPDLPLAFGGSARVGLGVYNNAAAALIVEFGLFAAGITYYLLRTKATSRTGRWAFWTVPVFMVVSIIPSLVSPRLEVLPTLLIVLLMPIGMWVDKHRCVRQKGLSPT